MLVKQFDAGERREFISRLIARQQVAVDALCSGSVESFDEYKDWTGYLRALKDVFSILEEVRKDVNNDWEGTQTHARSTDEDPGNY